MIVNRQKDQKLRGVVRMSDAQQRFSLERFFPSDHLKDFIEHYWLIGWDLPDGMQHTQYVAAHPATNMTFLPTGSTVTGIVTKQFEHTLKGAGNLVGVRFTPAGFYAFAQQAGLKMTEITDHIFDIERFFKVDVKRLENEVLALEQAADKTQMLELELFHQPPELDANVSRVNDMVRQIEADKSLLKVADICQKFKLEERQLQRLFNKYIGVNAKWIINRYRIHEALEQIETNDQIKWSDMALKLGYYDQAHFIKDFKNLIGQSPHDYFRSLAKN